MIASQDRSYYIGASDCSYVIGNWKTKTWLKWWTQKIGIYNAHFDNVYTLAGTHFEHRILESFEIPFLEFDKQIINEELRLRVNLDGTAYQAERDIYENKIHEYYMPREESSYLRVASVSGTGLLKIYNTFLLNGCPEGKNKNNVFALEIQLQNEEFGSVSMVGFPIKTNHSDRLEFNVLGAGLSDEQTTEFKIKATVVFRSDGMIEVIPSKYQYHINYYKTTDYTISTDATVTLYFR